ncbi:hypothetical protein [Streptomyces capoamus]|uniref:hypothetical protein n=1 Tax=Streptomyces capoamus TaxID=68183 RepID=UPI003397B1F1
MVSRAKETHTTNRVVRVPDADWEEFGQLVGERNRSQLLREFIAWYLRRPKSTLPKRPDARDVQAARNIAES